MYLFSEMFTSCWCYFYGEKIWIINTAHTFDYLLHLIIRNNIYLESQFLGVSSDEEIGSRANC